MFFDLGEVTQDARWTPTFDLSEVGHNAQIIDLPIFDLSEVRS